MSDENDNEARPTSVPGLIEIQFEDGARAELAPSPGGGWPEFRSESESFEVGELNKVLGESGFRWAERVFDESEDEIAEVRELGDAQGVSVPDLSGFYHLHFDESADVNEIARKLRKIPGVVHAAAIPYTRPACADNVPLPSDDLLGTDDTARDLQWYIFRCKVDRAWARGYRGRGVVVADLDYGFAVEHPDLRPGLNIERAFNAILPSPSDPGNVSEGQDLHHGTGVLGFIGAAADGAGMVGVAPCAEMWPIQVGTLPLQFDPLSHPWAWLRGLSHVTRAPSPGKRKVIVLEGETFEGGNITQIASVRMRVLTAIARGAVVCVAGGNGGGPVEIADNNDPFKSAGIIVGATRFDDLPWREIDANGTVLAGTNHGGAVVVSAPGDPRFDRTCEDNVNTPNLHRLNFGGTSGATAKVAGVVALMLEANDRLRYADVVRILSTTGSRVRSPIRIGNLLDCEAAVLASERLRCGN